MTTMLGVARVIEAGDDTVGIEEVIARRGMPAGDIGLGLGWRHIALLVGCGGSDGQQTSPSPVYLRCNACMLPLL
jgi:hypothetical protein